MSTEDLEGEEKGKYIPIGIQIQMFDDLLKGSICEEGGDYVLLSSPHSVLGRSSVFNECLRNEEIRCLMWAS